MPAPATTAGAARGAAAGSAEVAAGTDAESGAASVAGNGRITNQKVDGQAPQRLEAAGLRRFRVPAARGLVIVLALGFAAQRDVCTCV